MEDKPVGQETNEKTPDAQDKSVKSQYESLEKEELVKLLEKKEKVAQDKHNFAMSKETELEEAKKKLEAFEKAEAEKAQAELVAKGDFETIKAQILAEKSDYENKYLTESTRAKLLEDEKNSLEAIILEQTFALIPEDKREWANELTEAYTGTVKIEKLKKIAETFKETPSFGGVPEKKAKKEDEMDAILAKYNAKTPLTPAERNKLTEYLAKKAK